MLGVVVALDGEAEVVLKDIKIKKEQVISGKRVIEGKLYDKQVVIIITNVGKVNSAFSTQLILDKYKKIDTILNFGIVGSVTKKLKLGSVCAVNKIMQFDFDLSEIDNVPVGQLNELDAPYIPIFSSQDFATKLGLKSYTLGTSDKFNNNTQRKDELKKLKIDICDMEAGAVAQVCYHNKKQLIIIKAVSDYVGENLETYQKYYKIGVENLSKVVKNLIEIL